MLAHLLLVLSLQTHAPAPIADNSFLIEEAYNQEARVVQHINTLLRFQGEWTYSLTQEWPLGGQRHQLSYTVPITTGLGDIGVNYRHQVAARDRLAFAPRLTVLLPSGDADKGLGTGRVGFQANLPVSAMVAPSVVVHGNAGATVWTSLDETVYNAGASAIWRAHTLFNVMLELTWTGTTGQRREDLLILNPGVRWAHNLGTLQIVPGVAVPIDLGPGKSSGVFLYLSLEHPF